MTFPFDGEGKAREGLQLVSAEVQITSFTLANRTVGGYSTTL